jgi:hypothetical protein
MFGDLDERVKASALQESSPAHRRYTGTVRKVIYRDPDGNEIGLCGAALD